MSRVGRRDRFTTPESYRSLLRAHSARSARRQPASSTAPAAVATVTSRSTPPAWMRPSARSVRCRNHPPAPSAGAAPVRPHVEVVADPHDPDRNVRAERAVGAGRGDAQLVGRPDPVELVAGPGGHVSPRSAGPGGHGTRQPSVPPTLLCGQSGDPARRGRGRWSSRPGGRSCAQDPAVSWVVVCGGGARPEPPSRTRPGRPTVPGFGWMRRTRGPGWSCRIDTATTRPW